MEPKQHQLNDLWDQFPAVISHKNSKSVRTPQEIAVGETFAIGNFYYYTLNLVDGTISTMQPELLAMHGLKEFPRYLKNILDLIHPDDIAFVIAAEKSALKKVIEIGVENIQNLKCSYCFRMKTAAGNYELFHHQSVHISVNDQGQLVEAINIHSNIQHITTVNSYQVLLVGINGLRAYHQIQLNPNVQNSGLPEPLTRREVEILSLIAKGYSCAEIAKQFVLSDHTVRAHRKNIQRKTGTRNGAELIRKSLEWGLL